MEGQQLKSFPSCPAWETLIRVIVPGSPALIVLACKKAQARMTIATNRFTVPVPPASLK